MTPQNIFVYGTLKRGQCREKAWPAEPISVAQGWVEGTLFGRADYPALTFGDDKILGELWRFDSRDVHDVLRTLDEIEGTTDNAADDLYHRHRVSVNLIDAVQKEIAFAYFYNGNPETDGFSQIKAIDGFSIWPQK